jgi:hypothetical protein
VLHGNRTWCVSVVADAEMLVQQLLRCNWTLCTAFRLGAYLFLNDSTGEARTQEYAVVLDLGDGTYRQVESFTTGWMDGPGLLEMIREVLAGEYDSADYARAVSPCLEPAETHRCGHCA